MIRHSRWIFVALLGLLLFLAPLPFGGAVRGARELILAGCFLLFAGAMIGARSLDVLKPVRGALLALVALAALGLLQAASLPEALVDAVSPAHGEAFRQAAALTGEETEARLSLAPSASRSTALLWLALAAALGAAAVAGRHAAHRKMLVLSLLAAGAVQVVYGMQRWLGGKSTIWGREVPGNSDRLRGTFVNPDHFAVYLEICLAVAFAAVAWCWHRARYEQRLEVRLAYAVPPVLIWSGLFVALAFSGSRAGLVAALAGAGAQTVLLAAAPGPESRRDSRSSRARRRWRRLAVGAGLVAGGLAVVAAVGASYGFGRLLATSPYEVTWNTRIDAMKATFGLWQRFPWTGSGLGTFRDAFPLVQPEGLAGSWLHGHSDPLELLATGGLLAFVIALLGLGALVLRLVKVYRKGWRTEDRAAALAALGALVAVLAHECVDFGLTMPANALALVVLCGAAAASRLEAPRSEPAGLQP